MMITAAKRFKDFESLAHEMVNQLIDYIEIGGKDGDGEQSVDRFRRVGKLPYPVIRSCI